MLCIDRSVCSDSNKEIPPLQNIPLLYSSLIVACAYFWGFSGARRCSMWYKSLSPRWSQCCQQTFAQTTAAVCYLINTTESVHIYPLPCETHSQWLRRGSTLMSLWFTLTGLAVGVRLIWGHGGGVLRGNQRLTVCRSHHAANSHWLPPATQTQAHSDSWSTCITCIRRQLPLRRTEIHLWRHLLRLGALRAEIYTCKFAKTTHRKKICFIHLPSFPISSATFPFFFSQYYLRRQMLIFMCASHSFCKTQCPLKPAISGQVTLD